ncbi:MAG: 3-deoxy-manno-octulosonate cytidylyltransferase [Bacteroidales bacterium]|nr:3-deoxy-manno-octulosonate cytidylyltransferase [Bacteroidales bacterium]
MRKNDLNIVGIIPARMGSKKFPGKPMADILGMPMIGHVYNRMMLCEDFDDVYVATDDKEIIDYIKSIKGNVIETKESHVGAIDRVAEAVKGIEEIEQTKYDLVVLIQCDEPMVTSNHVGCAISPMVMEPDLQVTSIMAEITSDEIFEDPNEIKVVVDNSNNALYFSREPIPSRKRGVQGCPRLKLLGIDVFRRDFIEEFNDMFPTPLETSESIDLLRVLESGMLVRMSLTDEVTFSVNTPEELERVKKLMSEDYLVTKYLKK